jgi:hypothetical protein
MNTPHPVLLHFPENKEELRKRPKEYLKIKIKRESTKVLH